MNTDLTAPPALPDFDDDRVARVEAAVFAEIAADDRDAASLRARARRRRRGRIWIGVGAAAAVVVLAAVIAPGVQRAITPGSGGDAIVMPAVGQPEVWVPMTGDAALTDDAGGRATDGAMRPEAESPGQLAASDLDSADRDIIANASMTLTVDEIDAAAAELTAMAAGLGGYVESQNIDGRHVPSGEGLIAPDIGMPYPGAGAWVRLRIPADQLDAAMERAREVGTVEAYSIGRHDVTDQVVDLDAQVAAAEASVQRLTELMAQATTVADLLTAESALAERQAMLDSYRGQLEMLQSQVQMSSLTVSLSTRIDPVEANPAGFADGLAAGWNGLIATLNGIVVALGFLLPWLVIAAVGGLIVWGALRLRRRRRAEASSADDTPVAR